MSLRSWGLVPGLAALLVVAATLAETEEEKADLATLKSAEVGTDAPALLAFFKKRTLSDETRTRIAKLIESLGADEFAIREKATADLLKLEGLCRAQVVQALKDPDLEIRKRARSILNQLGPAALETRLYAPAARVLARRKPDGAVKALLDFLPCIDDPDVVEETGRALALLALGKDGKPDALLLAALKDPLVIRRCAAGEALARAGGSAARPAVRMLLKDADPSIRRRVAFALLEAKDKTAIPTLIALVSSAASDDARAAEDMLNLIAGEKSPTPPATETAAGRERYRRAWEGWWKEHSANIDLAKIDLNAVGQHLLVVTLNVVKGTFGTVTATDMNGKVKWRLENLSYPIHASMSRRDRVLVCEYNLSQVSERDLKGNILWSKRSIGQLLSAERLANGNTFVATRAQLYELDKDGRQIKTIAMTNPILAAHRYKDGTYQVLQIGGTCAKLDSTGKVTNSYSVGFVQSAIGFRAHFLPNGGIIVPDYNRSKIREFDGAGTLIKEMDASRPNAVVRLPNGHTLYTSRMRNLICELDRSGKEISTRATEGRPVYIERR
jgi:ketosteroid isomerase-like protein